MHEIIIRAIREKKVLKMDYDGGIRLVEPHCYGITTAENPGLRAFQVDGYSKSGVMDWKMFDLSKAGQIAIGNLTFDAPRPGYKRGDKGMIKIFAEL